MEMVRKMKTVNTKHELQAILQAEKRDGRKIGFIPTMGFLHEGHGSLITKAVAETDYVVMSIFVNPMQFGPNEDFEQYPRDFEKDQAFAKELGVDLLFYPSVEEIYPIYPSLTVLSVGEITDKLCGASRPGHFDGVATVIAKLFNIVQPDQAFFGSKDAQQVAVIAQMVTDLFIPVEIVICPTIREEDGLAKSSRNVYLNTEERKQAVILSQSLDVVREEIKLGNFNVSNLRRMIRAKIETQPLAKVDYIEILTYPSLLTISEIDNETVIVALAVKFGNTRLIDNCIVKVGS